MKSSVKAKFAEMSMVEHLLHRAIAVQSAAKTAADHRGDATVAVHIGITLKELRLFLKRFRTVKRSEASFGVSEDEAGEGTPAEARPHPSIVESLFGGKRQ